MFSYFHKLIYMHIGLIFLIQNFVQLQKYVLLYNMLILSSLCNESIFTINYIQKTFIGLERMKKVN